MGALPNHIEWIFWISALTLTVFSLAFAFLAFVYSNRTSKKLHESIIDSFISDGASKLFFNDLKSDLKTNKELLSRLNSKRKLTYRKYNIAASIARMDPLPARLHNIIKETEFKQLSELYIETKRKHDNRFAEIFQNNYSVLSTNKAITSIRKRKLISYHKDLIKGIEKIVAEYTKLISSITQEVS